MAKVSIDLEAVAKILIELDLISTTLSSCTDEDDLDVVEYCAGRISDYIEDLKNLIFFKPLQEGQNDEEGSKTDS